MIKVHKKIALSVIAVAVILVMLSFAIVLSSSQSINIALDQNEASSSTIMEMADNGMQRSSIWGADHSDWSNDKVAVTANVAKNYIGQHTENGITNDVYDLIYTISITANLGNKMKIYEWQNYSVTVSNLPTQYSTAGVLTRNSKTEGQIETSGFAINSNVETFAIHSTFDKCENLASSSSGTTKTYNWRGHAGESHANGENQTIRIGVRVVCANDFTVTLNLPVVSVRKDIFSKIYNHDLSNVLINNWTMD